MNSHIIPNSPIGVTAVAPRHGFTQSRAPPGTPISDMTDVELLAFRIDNLDEEINAAKEYEKLVQASREAHQKFMEEMQHDRQARDHGHDLFTANYYAMKEERAYEKQQFEDREAVILAEMEARKKRKTQGELEQESNETNADARRSDKGRPS